MNHISLQALTWGTISAAIVSAMLLAAVGDDALLWRFEPPSAGVPPAAMSPRARGGSVERPASMPAGSASSADAELR